jgi:hypothetical protein
MSDPAKKQQKQGRETSRRSQWRVKLSERVATGVPLVVANAAYWYRSYEITKVRRFQNVEKESNGSTCL